MHGVLRAFYMPAIASVNREMVMKEGISPQIGGQAAGRHLAEVVTFDIVGEMSYDWQSVSRISGHSRLCLSRMGQ